MAKPKIRVAYSFGGISVYQGDSRDVLKSAPAEIVDSIFTDPPYALESIAKRFGKPGAAPAKGNPAYARTSRGFMGHSWDTGEVAFSAEFWGECYRVLKPGGYAAAFAASRNYHKLASALEAAGFEIRDSFVWLYGTGFPKSHEQSGDWKGWGTAVKPAHEPLVFARKPLAEKTVAKNLERYGVGAINVDACRIQGGEGRKREGEQSAQRRYGERGATNFAMTPGPRGGDARGRFPSNVVHDGSPAVEALLGDAARYFYSAKASKADRAGSAHPTVKPVDLVAHFVRLITPRGGLVLDPFAGSGTTAAACIREGMRCTLIERESEYVADIKRRLDAISGPDSDLFAPIEEHQKAEILEAVE